MVARKESDKHTSVLWDKSVFAVFCLRFQISLWNIGKQGLRLQKSIRVQLPITVRTITLLKEGGRSSFFLSFLLERFGHSPSLPQVSRAGHPLCSARCYYSCWDVPSWRKLPCLLTIKQLVLLRTTTTHLLRVLEALNHLPPQTQLP